MIVDAHLDIAWNALAEGRGFESEPPPGWVVSRSALQRTGAGLVFATLYCAPAAGRLRLGGAFSYRTPREAALMARAQAGYYRSVGLRLLRTRGELEGYLAGRGRRDVAAVLLMEGADPIEDPSRLGAWTDLGVRIIGPAWSRTRYTGGTGAPGGLTELGHRLLRAMARRHLILDLSHLAQQAVEESFDLWKGPVMASHSNARELVAGDRQVSAATVAEIGRRGGVVGISFAASHLTGGATARLEDVAAHAVHHARSAGGWEHVGLGTDLDGGFPASHSPVARYEDVRSLRGLLRKHFNPRAIAGIMGDNWLDFLSRSLPAGA